MAFSYDKSVWKYVPMVYTSFYSDSTGATYGPFFGVGSYGRKDYDIGTSNPNWHHQVMQGIGATTVRQFSRRTAVIPTDYVSYTYTYDDPGPIHRTGNGTFSGSILGLRLVNNQLPGTSPHLVSDLVGQAVRGFRKKVVQSQTSFQGGVVAGELHQTIASIRHPAQSLRRALGGYLDACKGHILRARGSTREAKLASALRGVSGSWLEFQYGIRPTLADIDDGAEALAQLGSDVGEYSIPLTFTAQGRACAEESLPVWNGFEQYPHLAFRGSVFIESIESVRLVGAVKIRPPVSQFDRTIQSLGLGFDRFVPTLWELCPWSFLVDYFADIGGAIDAWSADMGSVAWSSYTYRQTQRYKARAWLDGAATAALNPNPPYTSVPGGVSPSPLTIEEFSIYRDVPDLGSFPTFGWRIPGLGSLQWANMAALASQQGVLNGILQNVR